MEYGSIERELHIQAAPEVVYQVISSPEHLREWWPDEADLEATPGATGTVGFRQADELMHQSLTVIEADPPRRFSIRWAYDGDAATVENSVLATFDLVPHDGGTLLRFAETGFDEANWSEDAYKDHISGWDYFLPRLVPYA